MVIEGTNIILSRKFAVRGELALPHEDGTGPVVGVYDENENLVVRAFAAAGDATRPGHWEASVAIPNMSLTEPREFQVRWEFDSIQKYFEVETDLTVHPAQEQRISDPVCVEIEGNYEVHLVIPVPTPKFRILISRNNRVIFKATDETDGVTKEVLLDRTIVNFSVPKTNSFNAARFEPTAISVHPENRPSVTSQLWLVTSQIELAASMLMDYIKKDKLEEILASLQWTQSDLMLCLFMGLQHFNSLPPMATSFTGTNMQGKMLTAWILCSAYQALSQQIQAEGANAFDFGGQTVSFNVDRSPSLNEALGRVESQIQSVVLPYKQLLGKSGVHSGDGSIGSQTGHVGSRLGRVGVDQSPLVRDQDIMVQNARSDLRKAHSR